MNADCNGARPIFSRSWFELGVVTEAEAQQDRLDLEHGDDPYPEHFRWRRFVSYVGKQEAIAPELARSLYELGEQDEDHTLGESIRSTILRREECPPGLFDKAFQSSCEHLKRIARARIGARYLRQK
jgi:hypothetical protein